MADTPSSIRKRILSVTPPNTDKALNENGKDGKKNPCSPKLVQDTKKRVVEADNTVKPDASGHAGNDPVRSGQPGQGINMADQNKNISETPSVAAVSADPIQNIAASVASNEPEGNIPLPMSDVDNGNGKNQRITRSALRRGRPRRSRAVSVDPLDERIDAEINVMEMLKSINTSMASSEIQRTRFENNIISSLDTKLGEIKSAFSSNVDMLQTNITKHEDQISLLNSNFSDLDVKTTDLEMRMCEIDDEISACRLLTENSVSTVNDHIGKVETSLAKDIEQIRESAESKINEHHEYQRKLEDRMQDMTKNIESENLKLNRELDDLKLKFGELETLVNEADSASISERSGACGGCTCKLESASSTGSVFYEDTNVPPPIGPNRQHAYRSLIVDGVIERPFENLAGICLKFITDMDISIDPNDIEVAFRLGRPDRSKPCPRPVKLVLKSEIVRDQIFYFKKRLRQSKIFNSFQLSLDLDKDLRVKMGILKRAANNARAYGREVYSQPQYINIDGVEYDLSHIDNIPAEYLKSNVDLQDPPPPPANTHKVPHSISEQEIYNRARKMSEKAIMITSGFQKTPWGLLFCSAGCFLSNFYRCSVHYQGYDFKSTEQGYQAIMAKTCNRPDIFVAIMETSSPALAKSKTGRMVKTDA